VHGVYIPEIPIDLEKEAARLKEVLERNDNVNIFICARHNHHMSVVPPCLLALCLVNSVVLRVL